PRNDEEGSSDLALQLGEQRVDMRQPAAFAGEYRAEGVALQSGNDGGRELPALRHRGIDDVDQPVGAVQAAPEIVVLAIGAAEEGAEAVELNALQRRLGTARTDRHRVVRRDPVDLDRVELVQSLALQEGKGGDIEIGIAEIGED